jgi:hypothetical protein
VKDTTPAMERKFHRMLMERSGVERLKMGCSMHSTAQALAKATISKQHPKASRAELKRLFFLHFYGADFPPGKRNRIALALSVSGGPSEAQRVGKPATGKPSDLVNLAIEKAATVRERAESYGKKPKTKAKRCRSSS